MEHEIIQVECPECSANEPVPHSILKEKPGMLVKCTQCDTIHPHQKLKTRPVSLRVVVSSKDTSASRRITIDSEENISINDEFVVEDDSGDMANFVQVTSIESGGKRVNWARADSILTIWARATDNVGAKISVNKGWETTSFEMKVDGEKEFTIGETLSSNNETFQIKKIKLRDGSSVDRKGTAVPAKYIRRVFSDSMERIEWLAGKKDAKKRNSRPHSSGPAIQPRGSAQWTLKRKEKD
ncbi:MAG: hypothetical protein KAR85_01720 [Methanosarcinales archaeon]|nr:hypothetical protein [Methanosarcinales archaeon]